jgi:serine/threonine-protein kinase
MQLGPGDRLGAYEILGSLGSGGMGEVYRARDTRLGRMVAVKLVSRDVAADSASADRLAREARLTSSLNHPNIVTVHDVGEADGRPFLVMELVDGRSLHDAMAGGRLPVSRAIELAAQVADGLAAAHDAGVIHRDLKPGNIMLTADGRPKIVDFGLGKAGPRTATPEESTQHIEGLTDAHAVVGTAGYMAPEQVRQRAVDIRADQFALGAILYEMLTGQRAFKRETPVQTMAAIVDSEPAPLVELVPDAPYVLVRIVERCLAKNPADRYASTRDLAHDLRDLRQTSSGGALSNRSAAFRRPARRSVTIIAGLAVLALAATATWLLNRGPGVLGEARTLLQRYDKSAQIARAATLLAPVVDARPDNAEAQALLAEAYWRQYEHTREPSFIDRASGAASAALRLDDRHAHTHVVLAMINNGQGRFDGALGEATRATELDARSSAAWREVGRALLSLRRMDESKQALVKAVDLGPDDWGVHNHLGALHMFTNRPAEALPLFERARMLAPDNTRAYNNLGSAYLLLDRLGEAAQMYERSLSIERNATAYANLGTIYYRQGLFGDAARAYEGAVSLPGATVDAWRNLGAASYWAPGLRARAKEAYEQAVVMGEQARKVNARDPAVLLALASSYSVLGMFEADPNAPARSAAARAIVQTFDRQPPQGAEQLLTLVGIYEALGDRAKAFDWLSRALDAGLQAKSVEQSPWLEKLRADERYAKVRKR